MNNQIIYYLFGLIFNLAILIPKIAPVIAQDKETKTTATDQQQIKDKLKERLNKIIEDEKNGKSKIPDTYNQQPDNNQEYAYFGNITEATTSSLLVAAQTNDTKKINYNNKTELKYYLGSGKFKNIDTSKIKINWFAIIIGNLQEDNSIKAKQIKFYNEKLPDTEKTIISGKITEIDNKTVSFNSDQNYTVNIPNKYFLKIEGVDESKFSDISIGDKLLAIVDENLNKESKTGKLQKTTYTLKSMYIFPSLKNPVAQENQIKEASNSATATPSAKNK